MNENQHGKIGLAFWQVEIELVLVRIRERDRVKLGMSPYDVYKALMVYRL